MASSEDSVFPFVKSVSDSTVGSLSASFAFYIQEKSSKNIEEVLYLTNTHGRKCHLNNNNSEENTIHKFYSPLPLYQTRILHLQRYQWLHQNFQVCQLAFPQLHPIRKFSMLNRRIKPLTT